MLSPPEPSQWGLMGFSRDPRYNWCCGGGGGLVALGDETLDFRMKSAAVKVDQNNRSGAGIVATACENCHTQLGRLKDHYRLGIEVKFFNSMVAETLLPQQSASAIDHTG